MKSAYTESSLAKSVCAPYSPTVAAACVAPGPSATAATSVPRSRALVRFSRAPGSTFPSAEISAKTQIPGIASDHLGPRQQLDHLVRRLARILQDLAGLLRRNRLDAHDLLGRLGLLSREAEVAQRQVLHRLLLRLHDPLEGGVARLVPPRRHRDQGGQRALHDVVAHLGLALDPDRAVLQLDVAGER